MILAKVSTRNTANGTTRTATGDDLSDDKPMRKNSRQRQAGPQLTENACRI
jgi:hypothetical protein